MKNKRKLHQSNQQIHSNRSKKQPIENLKELGIGSFKLIDPKIDREVEIHQQIKTI